MRPVNAVSSAARRLLDRMGDDQIRLSVLALAVGAAAGYGSIAFRLLIDVVTLTIYGVREEQMPIAAAGMAPLLLIAITTTGGLALGIASRFLFVDGRPQGVADVIEASALRNGRMTWRSIWAAATYSVCTIGIGGSVGREGPIVHLGAGLASQVGHWLHLSPSLGRTLLGCGVAAAVAAAFNAPIAGVFFALEVVVGHYGLGAFSPVVISSLIGTIVTRLHIGDNPAFDLGTQQVQSFWEVPAFILLGVFSAITAIVLMRGMGFVQSVHQRLGTPFWLQPACGGLLLGLIALYYPEVLGIGYVMTNHALFNETPLNLLIAFAIAKIVATSLCHGSRMGGGIFSPSLAIGALSGGAFGTVATALVPSLGSQPSVYAVIGMGAVAASTLGAPISTIIMIFELTTDYGVTFALMASVSVAALITRRFYGDSYFHWQLAQRDISVDGQHELGLLRARRVVAVMRDDHELVARTASLDILKARFRASHAPIFVVDDEHKLMGSISFEDLADAAFMDDPDRTITAERLVRRSDVVLTPDDDLATALRRCQSRHEQNIPVVRSRDDPEVVGEVRLTDLIRAYNQALLLARAQEHGRG
ncbi:MAG: chloride channel protein [Geminicoccaceae bacterium]|nr:chloride channel protein [Geminicoccaceae bacterium]